MTVVELQTKAVKWKGTLCFGESLEQVVKIDVFTPDLVDGASLSKLMHNPVALPKVSKIILVACHSSLVEPIKVAASSAYIDVQNLALQSGSPVRIPCLGCEF